MKSLRTLIHGLALLLPYSLAAGAPGAVPAGRMGPDECAALAKHTTSADSISLPTSGARVTGTTWESDPEVNGFCCRVMGSILPVDPQAPPINWEADLPATWNGKLLQHGGGGYNGRIPRTSRHPTLSLTSVASPLARGYVAFGSDSGHQASGGSDASFARNAEALANYGYMHIKKTQDAVRDLAEAAYGRSVQHVYFSGGSTGGREALTAAIRWPDTYDGILANYPTARFMGLRLWGAALTRAIYDDDSAGWIPPQLVKQIAAKAIADCDGLDGAVDGLVSNIAACRARSDALLDSFRCPQGTSAPDCLSPTQVERTVRIYHDGYDLPYDLANGFHHYEGYNSLEGVLMDLGSDPQYEEPLRSGRHAHHADRAYQFFTNFVMPGHESDFRTFDILHPGQYQDRLLEISRMIDATDADLSRFAANGGKIILVHGIEDASVSPLGVEVVYENIVSAVGRDKANGFIRFYLLPGLAHGGGNMSPAWDNLSALERWVESGIAPTGQTVTDATDSPTRGRTRPLCAYPSWPKYLGDGDINSAGSFRCVTK